jgi:hypothetical protein
MLKKSYAWLGAAKRFLWIGGLGLVATAGGALLAGQVELAGNPVTQTVATALLAAAVKFAAEKLKDAKTE